MPTATRTYILAIAIFITLPIIAACGYRPLSKTYEIPGLKEAAPLTVYMPMWSNATNEFGLETEVFNKVADWLQSTEHIILKKNQSEAAYLLTGTISTLDQTSSRGTVRLGVRYSLKELASEDMIWPVATSFFTKSYLITDDAFTTDSERQRALNEIADDLGEKIYIRFLNTMTEMRKKQAATLNESADKTEQDKNGSE